MLVHAVMKQATCTHVTIVLHRLWHALRCPVVHSTDVNEQNAQSRSADPKCTVKCQIVVTPDLHFLVKASEQLQGC